LLLLLLALKKGFPSVAGGWEGLSELAMKIKSDPTPTLPCEQGREHISST
jgi:hypothetical protein